MKSRKQLFPPGMKRKALLRIRARRREEAAQVAWEAYLEGRDPQLATWAFLQREARHEERFVPFSQMPLAERRRLMEEVVG